MRTTWVSTIALCALLTAFASAANAQSPKIRIIGPGSPIGDTGDGLKVAQFEVIVFFDYPLITCQPNQPDCNTKTVPVCVDFHTVEETATHDDFVPVSGTLNKTLTFSEPGDLPLGLIDVQIISDTLTEGAETFKVVISESTSGCQNAAALATREARATIVDNEPSQPPPQQARPDLLISSIRLQADCKIELTITNAGQGTLPDAAYNATQGVAIQMRRNNVAWGGIRLAGVDPTKKLKTPGASVTHVWFPNAANLKLPVGAQTLSASIDGSNVVAESNEGNNTTTTRVFCKR